MAPMPHSETYTATGAEDEVTGESLPRYDSPRRTRPCFSLPKAHASVDEHESGSNDTSGALTAKGSGREFWQWGCWGRYGLVADLRRWGKLPSRRGTWLAVLFMLHGRRTYELILLHGYIIFDLLSADYLIFLCAGIAGFAMCQGPVQETEISPIYNTGECPTDVQDCVLPVNVNITLQYKGAGALTDAIVSIDVYPKNMTSDGVVSAGVVLP